MRSGGGGSTGERETAAAAGGAVAAPAAAAHSQRSLGAHSVRRDDSFVRPPAQVLSRTAELPRAVAFFTRLFNEKFISD